MKVTAQRILILTSFILCFTYFVNGQIRTPKRIKIKDEFIHKGTSTNIPKELGNLQIKDANSFNRKKTNIGVSYESVENNKKTKLTVYIYPAGVPFDYRLREEFLKSAQDIANIKQRDLPVTYIHRYYEHDDYKVNGFRALINDTVDKSKSILELYECGRWFFKIRLSSFSLDSLEMENYINLVLNQFTPTKFVKQNPLILKPVIYYDPLALTDTTFFGCIAGYALTKLAWVRENVDSLERISGFPDIYFEMYLEAIEAFVKFEKEHPNENLPSGPRKIIDHVNAVIEAGFLEEYIMDLNNLIIKVPDGMKFDINGYLEWKKTHQVEIELNRFCAVTYSEKDE